MANYIITKHPEFFKKTGKYNFCSLEQLETLPNEVAFDSETTGLFAPEEDMFCCQIGDRTNNIAATPSIICPPIRRKIGVIENISRKDFTVTPTIKRQIIAM